MKTIDYSLYVVTDKQLSLGRNDEYIVEEALKGGAGVIQYREKTGSFRKMAEECRRLKALTAAYGRIFLVNDRVDLAYESDADGVHLGQDDMPPASARRLLGPEKVIGLSVQTVDQAVEGKKAGVDYLAVSGVFPTKTKLDVGAVLGLDFIEEIVNIAGAVPVIAIGGINRNNASEIIRRGAAGVAVVSAVVSAVDIRKACKELLEAVKKGKEK